MNAISSFFRIQALVLLALGFLSLVACNQGSGSTEPLGRIDITTDPGGTEITLNGEPASTMIEGVAPGDHLITASRAGYRTARKTVTLVGRSASVSMQLEPVGGLLLVQSDPPGADVKVGKIASGTTPLLVADCPLGTYPITFTREGYNPLKMQVNLVDRIPKKVMGKLNSNTGGLRVNSFPEGAEVTVDGTRKGMTPLFIEYLDAGRFDVILERDGYETFKERVSITAGKTSELEATLTAKPGGIRVTSAPIKARVYLDDQLKGLTIADVRNVKPGTHTLRVEKDGYEPEERTVVVENGKTITEEFKLEKNVGRLVLTTYPAGVTVIIDGEKVGVTERRPLNTDNASKVFEVDGLSKGVHTLQLARDKHEAHREEFEISGDEAITISHEMKRIFVKDWEIWVRGKRWVGSKVEEHFNGDVTMETAPGILRRFAVGEIQRQKAYVTEK